MAKGEFSRSNLAAAYGVAITMTMVITTLLFYVLVRDRWNWSLPVALAGCGFFLLIDLAFLGANRFMEEPDVPGALAQCHLLWDHLGVFLLAERRKPPGFPTEIPDGSRRAATK